MSLYLTTRRRGLEVGDQPTPREDETPATANSSRTVLTVVDSAAIYCFGSLERSRRFVPQRLYVHTHVAYLCRLERTVVSQPNEAGIFTPSTLIQTLRVLIVTRFS